MWRHIVSNFLSILIVILLALGAAVAWGQKQFTGPGPLAEAVCFVVPQGFHPQQSTVGIDGDQQFDGARITLGLTAQQYRDGLAVSGRAIAARQGAVTQGGVCQSQRLFQEL